MKIFLSVIQLLIITLINNENGKYTILNGKLERI